MKIIEVRDFSFRYENGSRESLSHVSLDVEEGTFNVLCGKSGCGKSTLLRQLKSDLAPFGSSSGKICYYGRDLKEVGHRQQSQEIGYVLQNPENQIVTDKVWHELAFGLENMGMAREEIGARIGETAEYFGIAKLYERTTNSLSGGQKQLLNLAAVMTMQPKVIILDEPTAQLDPIAAEKFIQMLHKINDELGTTVIISEHRLDQLLPVCSKAVVMKNGEILADDNSYKVADKLYNTEEFQFMPIPAQIYKESGELSENIPLTVGQGRKWIENYVNQNQIIKENIAKQNRLINLEYENKDKNKSAKDIAISGKNIWFRYERDGADIIKGISVNIENEQIYCILGGNGAGKSTLIKILCGILKQYRGKVKINGKIVYMPQNVQTMFLHDTVIDEVDGNKDILTKLNLDKYEKTHPYDLSGGEQQKLAMAKVLLCNPDILLLDEPTKGIDVIYKKEMGKIILDLKKQGKTIVIVSHDVEFCAEYGDRCAMFFQGKIISESSIREMICTNRFYTTVSHKMAGELIEKAITKEEVVWSMTAGSITE